MTKFSVLIPVNNREKLIGQTIDSVLAQTYSKYELIVIDDGSTDRTSEVIASYANRLTHLDQSNQGPEVARNAGAVVATGEYLAFLDSDDVMFPWALEVYAKVILQSHLPGLVLGSMYYSREEKLSELVGKYNGSIEAIVYKDYFSKDVSVGLSNSIIVIKRSLFDEIGGLRRSSATTFHSDECSLVLRCGSFGPMVLIKHPTTVAYRMHQGNSIHNVPRMCQGAMSLIRAERKGEYPGGKTRLLDRYACIGGYVYDWSKEAFRFGFYGLGMHLFAAGSPMIFVGALKKLRVRIMGAKEPVRLA